MTSLSFIHWLHRFGQLLQRQWRRLPLLDRWLLNELLAPLLFGIAAFTAVSLSVGVVFELVRKVAEAGMPLAAAGQVLALRLPGFMVLSFPMATLLSSLLAFSRLTANSELTALRSLGVKTWRMVVPALVLSLAMTALTFVFNDFIVPRANLAAANTFDSALGRGLSAQTGKNVVYSRFGTIAPKQGGGEPEEGMTHLFYAKEFKAGVMNKVTLLDLSRQQHQQMLTAQTAVWNEAKAMWEFRNGRLVVTDVDKRETTSADFERYYYPFVRTPLEVGKLPSDAAQMTVAQAMRAQAIIEKSGNQLESRRLRVRIQEKFSFPAICLIFGLIGSSLGVRPNARTSRSQGFGISVMLIFGYYLMSFIFSSLGIKGTLAPFLSAWSPVLIGLAGGLLLLRQASR
ncbi:MAG: LptF/LptG family permease [Vulcanococcus sp.]